MENTLQQIVDSARKAMISDDLSPDVRNQFLLDLLTALSEPSTARIAGTFTLPTGLGRVRGQRRRAFSFVVGNKWHSRIQVKKENGNVYKYWVMYRRRPGHPDKQQNVSVGKWGEGWEPTEEFVRDFNTRFSLPSGRPSRTEVMALLILHGAAN